MGRGMRFLRRRQPQTQGPDPADPDARLVAWAQRNPQAFVALYDRYYPAVFGYCLGRLRDPAQAEDATSQTFMNALADLPHYRDQGRFRQWLFTIAHNAIVDGARANRHWMPLETAALVDDPAASPEERALAALDLDRIEDALARLAPIDAHVLALRRAGLNGPEIAQLLGISHDAAKKRQLRALDRLAAELGEDIATDSGAKRHAPR